MDGRQRRADQRTSTEDLGFLERQGRARAGGLVGMFSQCGCGSQPQTYDSQKLATQQVDKSVSDLKEALNGLGDSLKKGDRKSFSLYKQQAIGTHSTN
jgi:hypothetical protein